MAPGDARALMQQEPEFESVDDGAATMTSTKGSSAAKAGIKLTGEVTDAIARGDVLEAIGLLRNANPRLDLASTKDVIDEIRASAPKHPAPARHQQRVPTVVEGDRDGHAWLVVIVVAIVAAVAWWLGADAGVG